MANQPLYNPSDETEAVAHSLTQSIDSLVNELRKILSHPHLADDALTLGRLNQAIIELDRDSKRAYQIGE